MWSLTCPFCLQKHQTAIILQDCEIVDEKAVLACYCHACKKGFKIIYVRPAMEVTLPVVLPEPHCKNTKLMTATADDCIFKGCPYWDEEKCQYKFDPNTNTAANTY